MSRIPELNKEAMEACQLYVDNLIKPIHSLGKLEEIAVRIAGVTGKVKPSYLNKAIVIFGGDTASDGENKTKGQLSHDEMKLVAQGAGPVNAAARMIDAPVYLLRTLTELYEVLNRIRLTLKASSRRRSSAARTSATLPWMMK